jgi:uncharacterized membrane protein
MPSNRPITVTETTLVVDDRAPAVAWTVYLLLFPVPVVAFLAALATDGAYAATAYLMWLHFSEWLIAAGLAFGVLAALALLVAFVTRRVVREAHYAPAHLVLFYVALVVELVNAFVHTADGWTAVVPTGLVLSAVAAILALAAVATLFFVPDERAGTRR